MSGVTLCDMMGADISIRPYQARDRGAVREICYRTGYMGEPASWYWRDFQSFADIWTGYYTEREPQSAFVALRSGRIVGYLLGCIDTAQSPDPAAAIMRQCFRRFLLLRPGTAGYYWRALGDLLRFAGTPIADFRDSRWPSHLHIDLLPEGRGLGAGNALMQAWFERLAAVGSPGCHLATLAENQKAIAFFRRLGFQCFGHPAPVPGMRSRSGARLHQQIMVWNTKHGRG